MSLSAIAMEPSDSIVGFLKCVMQMLSTVIRNEIRDIRNIKKWHLFSDPTQLSISCCASRIRWYTCHRQSSAWTYDFDEFRTCHRDGNLKTGSKGLNNSQNFELDPRLEVPNRSI